MFAWLICSAIAVNSLLYGLVPLSVYCLALSCVLPAYLAKELQPRQS
jgi:hypothetical protein